MFVCLAFGLGAGFCVGAYFCVVFVRLFRVGPWLGLLFVLVRADRILPYFFAFMGLIAGSLRLHAFTRLFAAGGIGYLG